VNPSHSKVFYIDTGVSPRIDASYVGYRVTNATGATLKGYWVSLTNFVGGQVGLANSSDQYMQLPDIANNSTQTVYFLLKASASSKIAQSHDVKVWSKRPDLATATNAYGCTFSFKKVAETIKASANKPLSTSVSAIGAIGSTFVVTSTGSTGTIGAGNPDVGRILWFTPAAYSSFPTRAFRLEKVTLAVTTENAINNNTDYRFYNDRLLVDPTITPNSTASVAFSYGNSNVTTADNLVGKRKYQNEYTFRVIAAAPSTSISPLAQISSGTQIKHTAIDANGTATLNASAASITASLTKTVSSTSYSSYPTATINGSSYNEVPYKITLSSTSNTTTDEVVDTPPVGAIYKTGSTTVKVGSASAAAAADPETITAESALNPRPLHFVGPFSTTSSSSIVISYTMYVPAVAGTYTNTAYAKIGDQQVVASTGVAIPGVNITVGGDGKVSNSVTTTVALKPVPQTGPATAVTSSTATISGSIDANDTTTAGYFEWGTLSNLSSNTSVSLGSVTGTAATNFTSNLTSLTSGTTYYYRIVAVSFGVRYEGAIYSFTAYETASAPTVTTTTPTNVDVSSATLNASIDPNLQTITKIEFVYSINSNMSSPTTVTVFDLNEDGGISTTQTTLSGASPTDISWDISGLNTTTTYYYYAVITYSGGTVSGEPTKKSFKTGTTAQYISFSPIADKPFTDGSFTRVPLASSLKSSDNSSTGLTVTYTSETPGVCTVSGDVITFVSVGYCVITATQAGDSTYAEAAPVTQSFQILPSAPTATTQAATSVAITTAVLNGDFTTGGGGSTSVTFTYGTDSTLATGTTTVTTANSPATTDGSRTWSLSGLTAATTYYFRISASNTTGSANGSILNFTTQNLAPQTITWTTITSKYYGDTATAIAPATSGLATTITSLTPSICTVPSPATSGATVTILALGDCVLRSAQAGDSAYLPATSVDETFTVLAKPITVTAAAKTKVFGASNPTLTYTHSPALLGSDTFTGTLTRTAGENVGSYSILIGTLALPARYQLIYVGDTLTVTAKPLSITADNKSKNAGDPTPTFTYQVTGLVSGNTLSGITYNFFSGSLTDTTTVPTADGTYNIRPSDALFSSGSASNYTITYNNGTYSITSLQSQVLTWTTIGNKTYGTSPTGSVTSNQNLTPVTIVSNTTSICTVPNSSASGATITLLGIGVCELKASQPGNGTYGPATDVIETFTVLAAPLVITASSPTGIRVGDAVPTITASYSGFVNSENSSVLTAQPTCVTTYTISSAAGTAETTSCSGAAAANYTITYVAGSFVVAAANNGNNNNNPSPTPTPVVKKKTTIDWKNPTPIFVGDALGGKELNAIFSVPGTCVYTPALGTVLPEGTHTLSVTCTPTDGINYEPLTTTVTIQVKPVKKKASIIWFNPQPITYPTPLSPTQLNAKPSVPGTLDYTPPAGTVLDPGTHILNVKLKPNDPNYDELEAKVTILVKSKPADPKNPEPTTPTDPAKPEVKEPEAPKKPAKEAGPAAIPAARNAPVLQTAGKAAEVITVTPNEEKTGIIVSAPDWSLAISSTTKFVQGDTADTSARVVIEKGNTVTTSGTGFKPFSQVDVFVYSTPTWLGAVITDSLGNFTTTLPMPASLPEGEHTFQAEGLTPDNIERTAAVPITLIPAVATVTPGELRFEVYFGMNSVKITKAEAAKITRNVKAALAKAASDAKITVKVVGWVQPNPKPGDIKYLSTYRAKNVANLMKKLGLKGSYSLNFPGLEKDNIPSARHASVTIKWSISKSSGI
jgi:hypothetical protein